MGIPNDKLKLGPLPDDKPVKVALELPAQLHRDLVAYAEVLGRETGQPIADPMKLIVPMLERFPFRSGSCLRCAPANDPCLPW